MDRATEMLKTLELAKRYRVSPETVLDWARRGIIPSVRASRKIIRFEAEAVRQALAERAKREGGHRHG